MHVQEIPSGVRAITGVATLIAVLVGRTSREPVETATTVNGLADYERVLCGSGRTARCLSRCATCSRAGAGKLSWSGCTATRRARWDLDDPLLEAVAEARGPTPWR